jgi:hypothetical protein
MKNPSHMALLLSVEKCDIITGILAYGPTQIAMAELLGGDIEERA